VTSDRCSADGTSTLSKLGATEDEEMFVDTVRDHGLSVCDARFLQLSRVFGVSDSNPALNCGNLQICNRN